MSPRHRHRCLSLYRWECCDMSISRRFGRLSVVLAAFGLMAVFGTDSQAQTSGAARLETFTPREGEGYFALSLLPAPTAKPATAAAHDILVVVDTSASQVNQFRDK